MNAPLRPPAVAVLILFAVLVGAAPAVPVPDITAKEIIEKVQSKYDDLSDAVIRFTQTVRFKVSKAEQQVSGTLYFKKKNRYRIETEQRILVTDGKTAWSYTPQNKQVIIDRYKEESQSLSPEQLLVRYPNDFFSALVGEEKVTNESCYVLKLTPKEDNSFATSLKLWITKQWTIKKIELTDVNGGITTYLLKELTIDKGIPDSKFEFKPPPDANVIDMRS